MNLKKISAITLMVLVASLLVTGNALAHALLLRSLPVANSELPQPPEKIEMWFSEPLEADFSSARLLSTSGEEIRIDAAELDPNDPTHLTVLLSQLDPGIYTVAWKTLSRTDGHEWYGSFPFTVLNPDGTRPDGTAAALDLENRSELPTLLQTISRWLALMGGILFLSVPLFYKFVLTNSVDSNENLKIRLHDLAIKIVTLSVLAVILGSWLQIALQASRLESLSFLPRLIYATHTGALILSRQALLLSGLLLLNRSKRWQFITVAIYDVFILLLCLVSGIQGEVVSYSALILAVIVIAWAWRKASIEDQSWNSLLILGFITLLYFSLGSHAVATAGSFWAILSDYIHLLATSAWVGGLMLLPLVLDSIRGNSPAPERAALGPLFRNYGYIAKFSFFLLLTSGLFNSLVQFPTFASIIHTAYGRVLLIKLAAALIVWQLSTLSIRILRGKMDAEQFAVNLKLFIQKITQATLIGLVLMLAVAVLVQTQPPKSSSPQVDTSYHNIVKADDLSIHIQVTPNEPGSNQFYVQLSHEDDSLVGDVQLVRLLFNYEDAQVGQSNADLTQLGAGSYTLEGVYLNQPGMWTVSVYVRRRGMDDVIADLRVNVPDPAEMIQKTEPFQSPVKTVPVNGILSGLTIALSVEIFRWRATIKQIMPGRFNAFIISAYTLIGIGTFFGVMAVLGN
ncbi:copper resistance protein CopC [Candidatus Villigracilis saccharophilus]|uniref:copper resistance CopC/CopD family protein n=1 Tax=Candidatus Villigracilis saccharophilus TaxID=3140684 RepID=UPI003134A6AB|nr:copper resistance protein CopC [Anaerolineales bacterium]